MPTRAAAPAPPPPTDAADRGPRRGRPRRRPVLLGTLGVRVDPEAERMAVDSAVAADVPLLVANVLPLPLFAATVVRLQPEFAALRETVARAQAAGVRTELLTRLTLRRPHVALCQLARERDPGLVVLGPDPRRIGRRRLRRAARAVHDRLDCLVWVGIDLALTPDLITPDPKETP